MKKNTQLILLLFMCLFTFIVKAQTFEQVLPPPPAPQIIPNFEGVYFGSLAFSDIDNDGDEDVLITGQNISGQRISKLYTNDGTGFFTEVIGTPFEGVYRGSIAFSDIDNDGDEDVLITGQNSLNQYIAKLYTNDGTGVFTEVIGTPFDGVLFSSIAFSDIDNDGDQDVLITGQNSSVQRIAKLYTNDGTGVFTEVIGTPFDGVYSSSIAFSDIDNDGYEDVLITGYNISGQTIAKLYTNDGTGFFTEVIGTPFEGIYSGSIAFSDIDDDGGQDVLITGYNNSYQRIAKLYTNDGTGVFTEVIGTPFDSVLYSSIAFSDIDNDGDEDLLITGENNSGQRIAKLYTNDGTGAFTEVIGTPFDGVYVSSIAFSDIDNDGDEDVLITGFNSLSQYIAKLYTNDGTGVFTEVADASPTASCQNYTAQLDASGNVTITGANVDDGSSDLEGAVTLSVSPDTFSCTDIGSPVTVTLTVTDNTGNTATCTATVTVEDNIDPVITCPGNISVNNDPGECGAVVTFADVTATDNCSSTGTPGTLLPGSLYNLTALTGSWGWGVSDWHSNIILDNATEIAAVETILSDGYVFIDPSTPTPPYNGIYSGYPTPISQMEFTSNSGPIEFDSFSFISTRNNSNATTITIEYRTGGGAWNTVASTTSGALGITTGGANTYTIPFAAITADQFRVTTNLNQISFHDVWINGSAASAITIAQTGTSGLTSGDVFPVGTTTLEYTATDGSGNTDTCTFTVTVNDTEDPEITCPAPITISNDPGVCGAVVTYAVTATDNCEISRNVLIIRDDFISNAQNLENALTAIGYIVTITSVPEYQYDGTNPSLNSFDAVIHLNGSAPAWYTDMPLAGQDALVDFVFNQDKVYIANEWNAYEYATYGNLQNLESLILLEHLSYDYDIFDYTVVGGQESHPLMNGVLNNFTLPDTGSNIGLAKTYIQDPTEVVMTSVNGAAVVLRTLGSGGKIVNFQHGLNEDDNALTDTNLLQLFVNGVSLASNSAVIQTAGLPSESEFPIGTTTNTFLVTDASGNTDTCTFTVTVNDTEDPTWVTTPADMLTVECDPATNAAAFAAWLVSFSGTDNCGTANVTDDSSGLSNLCGGTGTETVTFTLDDGNGNDITADATFTIVDTTNPTWTVAPADMLIVECDPATNATDFAAWLVSFSGTDTCASASVTNDSSGLSNDCGTTGTETVTFTLTDECGNFITQDATFTIVDTTNPTWTVAPADMLTVECDPATNATDFAAWLVSFSGTDTCASASVTNDSSGLSDDCGTTGTETVTFTLTDECGNFITQDATFTIVDTTNPTWTVAPDDMTVECDGSGNTAEFAAWLISFAGDDVCASASVTHNSVGLSDDCGATGTETVTFTLTDECGNFITQDATFTIDDTTPAIIACPGDVTAIAEIGSCGAIVIFQPAVAMEECGGVIVYQTGGLGSGSVFPVGDTVVEYTAQDDCGNLSTCTFIVTVEDEEAPVANCINLTIQLDEFGDASISADDVDGVSTDNCAVDFISIDIDTFDCSDVGDNNVTLTVTDVNGNESTCVAIVTVEDVTAPEVFCQDITIELDGDGMATITGLDMDAGSSDACGIASYELSMDSFDCNYVGDNTVTLYVTDVNGNMSSCTAIVTVEDNIAPELVCMDVTIELGEDGITYISPSDLVVSVGDACGIVVLTADLTEVSCADIGIPIEVNIFAIDNNGNPSFCSLVVTVVDTLGPDITCPPNQAVIIEPNGTYTLGDYIADGIAAVTDNCTDPVTIFTQDPVAGTVLGYGIHNITFSAEDEYGNVSTCSFELNIQELLGNEDIELGNAITMYPNPADSKVTITNSSNITLETAMIYDVSGKLISKINLQDMQGEKVIDVSEYSSGVYLIRIIGDQASTVKQLIKK